MTRTQNWMAALAAAAVFAACGELPEEPQPQGNSAVLTVRVEASGEDIDDTVFISLDGGTPLVSSGGSSLRFLNIEFGRHDLAVSGVSKNCAVNGGESQSIEVDTTPATVTVRLTCSAIVQPGGGGGGPTEE